MIAFLHVCTKGVHLSILYSLFIVAIHLVVFFSIRYTTLIKHRK